MLRLWLGFIALTLSFVVEAQTQSSLKLNPIRLTNRAQCALDSKNPAYSAFVILDGYNPGRLMYGWGKAIGQPADQLAEEGMLQYRLTVAKLQTTIMQKLLKGELPLLPADLSGQLRLKNYQRIALSCQNSTYCPDLYNYIQKVWQSSKTSSRIQSLNSVDAFNSTDFVPTSSAQVSCYYLKKFSPLQSHLHGTDVTAPQLQALGDALKNPEEFLTDCQNPDPNLGSRNVALQMEILPGNLNWNQVGFNFWNSVRIYTSWAWRMAPELDQWNPQFAATFRSLDLEESMLMIPNGCQSLTIPQCESETLSANSIRELAKPEGTPTEFDQLIPDGPEKEMLEKGARSVNNDFLSTQAYETANKWVDNFRKNFVEQRWIYKNKLHNAHQQFTVIADTATPVELVDYIKSLIPRTAQVPQLRDEFAFLCLEWRLAADKRIDYLSTQIENVAKIDAVTGAVSSAGLSVKEQIEYFKQFSQGLGQVCDYLETQKYFQAPGYITNWSGLADWAKELTQKSMNQDKTVVPFVPAVLPEGLFLTLGSSAIPFCSTALDCGRKILKSGVDLYAVGSYADAFLTKGQISAPDVFNPYAEMTACKMYDPWFVKNKTRKIFMADLANTALFGWNNIPVYIDVDYSAPKVTSFKKMMDEGVIKFSPNIRESKAKMALLADFGPLLGAPCAVHIAPNSDKAFNFYAFSGIALNYCKVNMKSGAKAENPSEITQDNPDDSTYCAGCVMNFVGVSSAASSVGNGLPINPLKFGVFLFRAIYKFVKGMKDKVNVPKTYVINLDHVREAHARFGGKLPDYCAEPLSRGLKCFETTCGARAAEYFEKVTGVQPTEVKVMRTNSSRGVAAANMREAYIKTKSCKGSVVMRFNCNGNPDNSQFKPLELPASGTSNECERVFRGKF